jgi:hypothetical protein
MAEDNHRDAEKRAQYITRTTDLDYRKALALAYSEQGCSERGIADNIDSTKATVSNYLDEISDRYGSEVVLAVDVGEKDDLTLVKDKPTKQPVEDLNARRKVVLKGEYSGPHTVERYFRSWTRDGRIIRDEKVALSLQDYDDEHTHEHLSDLEWDSHHCKYDPEYEFVSADVDPGAWTFDTDTATLGVVRAAVDVPPLDTISLVAETMPKREDADPYTCTNPACSAHRAHSSRDLDAYPRISGPAIEITQETDFETVSYVCLECRALFEPVPVGVIEDGGDK